MIFKKKTVQIFTDGACRGNPGPGGWGAILRYGKAERTLKGSEAETTNNRMELTAAIEALNALTKHSQVELTTDSKYVMHGITEWIHGWKKRNWRGANKKPVKNVDLWQALDEVAALHEVRWHWVKGHSGHRENELADELATQAIEQVR